jgi:hypothetical protein
MTKYKSTENTFGNPDKIDPYCQYNEGWRQAVFGDCTLLSSRKGVLYQFILPSNFFWSWPAVEIIPDAT